MKRDGVSYSNVDGQTTEEYSVEEDRLRCITGQQGTYDCCSRIMW